MGLWFLPVGAGSMTRRRVDKAAVLAMREKALGPEADRKARSDFAKRISISLRDRRNARMIEKIGHGRGIV